MVINCLDVTFLSLGGDVSEIANKLHFVRASLIGCFIWAMWDDSNLNIWQWIKNLDY